MKPISYWQLKDRPFKTATGFEKRYNCLFCDDDDFHLYVNVVKRVYHCFKCEAKGKVLVGKGRTLDKFSERLSKFMEAPQYSRVKGEVRSPPWSRLIYPQPGEADPDGLWALSYLVERGLTPEEVYTNKVRYSMDKYGPYSQSVIFTISNPSYFVCRKASSIPAGPKYVNAPWPKDHALYFPEYSLNEHEVFVLCEGVFDAIRIARVNPVAALLGKTLTQGQLARIVSMKCPLIVMLDHDAKKYAMGLCTLLAGKVPWIAMAEMEYGNDDPGNTHESYIKEAIDACVRKHSGGSKGD